MTDNFALLGISEDANPEQIEEAFNKKRAELIASIDDDQTREVAIAELQNAFDAISRSKTLALVNEATPPRRIDPLLTMVDNVNSSLHNEPDHFTAIPCIYCGARNPKEALICSACGRHISRPCPKCGKILPIDATVCNRCNTIIREFDQTRLFDSEHVREVTDRERQENLIRVTALEQHHDQRRVYGFIFWIILIGAIVGLTLLTIFLVTYYGLL